MWSYLDEAFEGEYKIKRALSELEAPNFEYNGFKYDWDNLVYITDTDVDGGKILVEYLHKQDRHIVINEDIEWIYDNAFENCEMESIKLPDTLRYIGREAFNSCVNLKFIEIPNGVKRLGSGAFNHCSRLEEIILPDSIKEIKPMCFRGCKSLTSIRIPSDIININRDVFEDCESMREISLNKVVDMYPAFDGCVNLKEVWSEQTTRIFFYMMNVFYQNFYSPIFEFWEDVVVHCKDGDLKLSNWYYYTDNGNVAIKSKEFWKTHTDNFDAAGELLKMAGLE